MVADGPKAVSVVTLLADSGDRYADTYFCDEWLKTQELDTSAPATALTEFDAWATGTDRRPRQHRCPEW